MNSLATRVGLVAAAVFVLIALIFGGTEVSLVPNPPAPAANAATPGGVHDPALPAPGNGAPVPSCDPLASLRPTTQQPTPGAMPANSTMAAIATRGYLTIGVDQNTLLFGFRNAETGAIEGFDVDIALEVATAIFGNANGHVKLVAVSSADRIPALESGKVDLVAHTMTMNCDRWQQISFSSQYYQAGQRVLVPKSSTVNGIDALGGKKVCAAAGSTSIINIAAAKSKPIPVSVNDWTDCLVMLQQGQVDAISTDDTILAGLAAQDPTVKMVGSVFGGGEPYGLGINKGHSDLVRFVNGVLAKARADGTWSAIYSRWLPGNATPPPAKYRD